eukprot:RCo032900
MTSIQALRRYVDSRLTAASSSTAEYNEEEDIQRHLKIIQEEENAKRAALETHPSYKSVPRFYHPSGPDSLRAKWKAEARKELLNRKSEKLWDANILHLLWRLLQEHCYTPPEATDKEGGTMDFLVYDKVRKALIREWNETARKATDGNLIDKDPFLTSLSFYRLPKDERGRVPILTYFNYVLKKVTLYQTRIELGANDSTGDGTLTESDLENYFYELIPTLPVLSRLPEHFYPFYVCGAVRKFFFFLDPQKRGHISIDAAMQSPVMGELLDLQNVTEDDDPFGNWFAATTMDKFYQHYLQLDSDHDGMLSRTELYGYNDGAFTRLFIDRVFEVSQTFGGKMDYKNYIEFVLCVENPASKPAFDFFWRVLDLHGEGYLTPLVLKMFFREVQARLVENNVDPPGLEDVVIEILDMINPRANMTVQKRDLEQCRNRDTIISLLVDHKAFWRYDNRESLASQQLPPPSSVSVASA